MKKALSGIVVAIVLLGSLGWAATSRARIFSGPASPEGTVIGIDNYSFMPGDIAVASGATITWINHDDVPHTVVSVEGAFKSKALDTDDKFSFKFDKPGTYEYYCSVHPRMTAKIIVK